MPPKASTTTKRKAPVQKGQDPKKVAVDKDSSDCEDRADSSSSQGDSKPNLASLPTDILYRIIPLLTGIDRHWLGQTCVRLYKVERGFTGPRIRTAHSNLAIRTTRTGKSQQYVEFALHDSVSCCMHERSHADYEEAKCSLTTRYGRTIAPFDKSACGALYWKAHDMDKACDIARMIVDSTTVHSACIETDLKSRCQSAILDILKDLQCSSVFLSHALPLSEADRFARVTEREEIVRLPSAIWHRLPFFGSARKLHLKGLFVEDYEELYQSIKASSLTLFSMIYEQEKNATPQLFNFFEEAMPWASPGNYKNNFAYKLYVWSYDIQEGIKDRTDRRWKARVVGKRVVSKHRRLEISYN